MDKDSVISSLVRKVQSQEAEIEFLKEKLAQAIEALSQKAVKKHSKNSSLPPSSDLGKVNKNQSLRKPSERKSGGQQGHEGHHLEIRGQADYTVDLKSEYCSHCGDSLPTEGHWLLGQRQVIDIPPIQPKCWAYQQYACICSGCQHQQVASYPSFVNSPIQYGPQLEALVSYLNVYQALPLARLQELLAKAFNSPLSQGSLVNMLRRSVKKYQAIYQGIQAQLAGAKCVGTDETSCRVKGKNWWIWVWQNAENTFLSASANRGTQTIEQVWGTKPTAFQNTTLVSDRLAAQLKTKAQQHQICLAHLQRTTQYLVEAENSPFALELQQLFAQVYTYRKNWEQAGWGKAPGSEATRLERKLDQLLGMHLDKKTKKESVKLQLSLLKYRDKIFPCLYDPDIPPDNNASERAIRNVKIKQKVSGQFKTGQQDYCVIRSVIDTIRKRKLPLFPTLQLIHAYSTT